MISRNSYIDPEMYPKEIKDIFKKNHGEIFYISKIRAVLVGDTPTVIIQHYLNSFWHGFNQIQTNFL